MKIYLNGKLVDKEDAKVSVFDHGLLYGDGVFEGIRSYDSLIFMFKEHLDRLYESARAIKMEIPMSREDLTGAVVSTLKANDLKDAYIRLVVTRGSGDLGLDPRKCLNPTIFIIADKIALYPKKVYDDGLEIITAKTKRNSKEALNPQIKSLNYLNNILARIEAINANAQEAVMLNADGRVAECTGDNIFIVKDGVIVTPPPGIGALDGITRQVVIKLAAEKSITVREEIIKPDRLYEADECFLTGTAAEIVPVTKIDGKPVGSGGPGVYTARLLAAFRQRTKIDGARY